MNTFRTKATINRLNMYNEKPDKDKMYKIPTEAARIQQDRKWFGNVRTIDQKSLEKLRVEMAQKEENFNSRNILIKKRNIPMSLLSDPVKQNRVRLLDVETYEETFGPKSRRKRTKLDLNNMEELAEKVEKKQSTYDPEKDRDIRREEEAEKDENRDKRMAAGQSKRIWEELYKVLDSSDVLVQILDARDPNGTRSKALEEHIKKNCPHKHVVLLLNKCDLVPVWVTAKWAKVLSKEYPTVAYRASISNPFGKGALINLFRQFDNFHKDKKSISIGFVGYPNVGKSSVINSLKEKKVCKAAPIPGETKVWQYIALTKRIYLIDCPGVVHMTEGKSDINSVLRGCVRAERIDDPCYYIPDVLSHVKPEHIRRIYKVEKW
jgi:nuclear GTP-binding protein